MLDIAASLSLFIWCCATTDLHVRTNSTLAVCMFTSPTFALLAICSFIVFSSVFPGAIHSAFADKNYDILIVMGADVCEYVGKAKIFFAVEFAFQFLVPDMGYHNVSHVVVFLFALVTVFRQTFQAHNKIVDHFTQRRFACKQFLSR